MHKEIKVCQHSVFNLIKSILLISEEAILDYLRL